MQLHRVRERFERSVTALLLLRHGRAHCSELAALAEGPDLSPVVRKRVARHAERCETCSARKRSLVAPLAALAAVPAIPAPAHARQMVLDRVERVSFVSDFGDWRADGFPPGEARDRAWRGPVLAGVLGLLLVLGLALFWSGSEPAETTGTPPTSTASTTSTTAPAPATDGNGAPTSAPPRRAPGGSPRATATTVPASDTSSSTSTTAPPTTTTTLAPSTTTTSPATTTTVPRIR